MKYHGGPGSPFIAIKENFPCACTLSYPKIKAVLSIVNISIWADLTLLSLCSHTVIVKISKHQIISSVIKVDLALLSLCSHTIMDYGTFGLWGGLLAGGEILAPTGYTRSVNVRNIIIAVQI